MFGSAYLVFSLLLSSGAATSSISFISTVPRFDVAKRTMTLSHRIFNIEYEQIKLVQLISSEVVICLCVCVDFCLRFLCVLCDSHADCLLSCSQFSPCLLLLLCRMALFFPLFRRLCSTSTNRFHSPFGHNGALFGPFLHISIFQLMLQQQNSETIHYDV